MELQPWFYFIILAYHIPTQIISFFIFYHIFFGPKKSCFTTFHKLFVINFVMGFLFFVTDVLFGRPALLFPPICQFLLSILSEPTYLLTPVYFGSYYIQFVQCFFCVLVAINRLTTVLFPLKYKRVWSKCYPASIVIILIFPLFFTPQVIFAPAFVTELGEGCGINYKKYWPEVRNSMMSLIVNVITLVCISFSTITTVVLLFSIKDRARTAEYHLITVGLILGSGALLNSCVQTYIYFEDTTPWTYFLKFCAIDITFLTAPWSLFLMTPDLLKSATVVCRKKSKTDSPAETVLFTKTAKET